MLLLDGKKILVTGVLSESSIACQVARIAQEEGAEILLTSPAQVMKATRRVSKRLLGNVDVLPFDVTSADDVVAVGEELRSRWGRVDGALHAIGFAPPRCFGNTVMGAEWEDVSAAMAVSCYSLKTLAAVVRPLMQDGGGSIVALSVDPSRAWPYYDWMGVMKGALEVLARYLARDLGQEQIRVNVVRAGPLRTVASRAVPELLPFFTKMAEARAPLGWSSTDCLPVARACILFLSDMLSATTGDVVNVDGGAHAMGADPQYAAEEPDAEPTPEPARAVHAFAGGGR